MISAQVVRGHLHSKYMIQTFQGGAGMGCVLCSAQMTKPIWDLVPRP